MKTVVGVGYLFKTLNVRAVNIVCDRQRIQKKKKQKRPSTPLKKPPKATTGPFRATVGEQDHPLWTPPRVPERSSPLSSLPEEQNHSENRVFSVLQ